MKQRLQPKSVALINDTLQDNVIMRLINTSCKQFESRMNTLRFSTIEPTLKSKACFRCLFITKIISG